MPKRKARFRRRSVEKVLLNLLVIVGSVGAVWFSYIVFTHQTSPVVGVIVLLALIGIIVGLVKVLRSSRYRWRKPGFKLVLACSFGVVVVCAFAGIEPLASYKDTVIDTVRDYVTTTPEEKEQALLELEKETFQLINVEREKHGLQPVIWDETLHNIAREHSRDMQEKGYLFHSPVGLTYAECCYGGPGDYSHYSTTAEGIVDSWMSSPPHRAWLLDGRITEAAVGIARDEGFWASWTFYYGGYGPPAEWPGGVY